MLLVVGIRVVVPHPVVPPRSSSAPFHSFSHSLVRRFISISSALRRHASSSTQTNGGANSMMGSAKEMVGGAVGSESMKRDGKQQHAEAETEKKTAQAADAADGLMNQLAASVGLMISAGDAFPLTCCVPGVRSSQFSLGEFRPSDVSLNHAAYDGTLKYPRDLASLKDRAPSRRNPLTQRLPESIVLHKISGLLKTLARSSCGSTNQCMQDLLALDHKTSSSPLCSSKKLDAFKNSIRKTPRALDIKSLQPFHAQDLFGIGHTQQDPSRLPTRSQIALWDPQIPVDYPLQSHSESFWRARQSHNRCTAELAQAASYVQPTEQIHFAK
ncbi:hypothetical protein B0H13DRAFT_1910387 [Mycena leptocephala]|nr:hypothetical protein B0H13DRAFT_1910387 [Mycena leptocephala]